MFANMLYLRLLTFILLICGLSGAYSYQAAAQSNTAKNSRPKIGPVTGLTLPRFVSLRSNKVNARTGPALRYPIQWIYKRAHLPVEITAEFDAWRQIRDKEGSISWVHSTLLSGQRSALIQFKANAEDANTHTGIISAYKKPNAQSRKVLEVEAGAIGEIKQCKQAFCLVDFKAYRGWVAKNYIWGIYPAEVIE
jgi:SH3-like domain-containing protein